MIPVLNNLVLVNEIRAFRIQQIDYKDRFTVFSSVHSSLSTEDLINQEVSSVLYEFEQKTTYYDKMKLLCNTNLSKEALELILAQISEEDDIKSHFLALGPEKIKALGYNMTKVRRELGIVIFSKELLINTIFINFKIGDRMINLLDFFEIKKCKISDGVKRLDGLEIIGVKPEYQGTYNNLKIINNQL